MTRAQFNLFLAGVLTVLSIGIGVFVYAYHHRPIQPEPTANETAPRPQTKAPSAGPWPECSLVVAWLQENSGDPKSTQVIRWMGHGTYNGARIIADGTVYVRAKVRAKNQFGVLVVDCEEFQIQQDRVINHFSIPCPD